MSIRPEIEIRNALILAQSYLPDDFESWPADLRGCALGTISVLKWVLGQETTFSQSLEEMKQLWQAGSERN